MRLLRGSVLAVGLWLVAAAYGCGGKSQGDDDGDPAGNGGTGGTTGGGSGGTTGGGSGKGAAGSSAGGAGSSGAGGTAGTGAGGGKAGTGASGGTTGGMFSEAGSGGDAGESGANGGMGAESGGVAGMSGSAGEAGAPSSGAECETADDCEFQTDCCSCLAAPKGKPFDSCPAICVRTACQELQVLPEDVTCSFGRCVFSRSCNAARVECTTEPPLCPEGQVPSVIDDCWGPCMPASDCAEVSSCDDCADGSVCVAFEGFNRSYHCVESAPGCEAGNYCDCLGVCGACSEREGAVSCPCGGC